MPTSRWKFDAKILRHAMLVCSESNKRGGGSAILKEHKRKLATDSKQGFRLRIERMPMWPNIAFGADGIQQTLTGVLIILMNIEVLPLPFRLPGFVHQSL